MFMQFQGMCPVLWWGCPCFFHVIWTMKWEIDIAFSSHFPAVIDHDILWHILGLDKTHRVAINLRCFILMMVLTEYLLTKCLTGLIICLHPSNERCCLNVTK